MKKIKQILLLFFMAVSIISCSSNTDSGDLGNGLDDYLGINTKIFLTKNDLVLFVTDTGKADSGYIYPAKLEGQDIKIIMYESLEDVTLESRHEILNGIDPMNPEVDKYFLEQTNESRNWRTDKLDHIYAHSSNFDFFIFNKNGKQYLLEPANEVCEEYEIVKYESSGVYYDNNLPADKADLSETFGDEPGTEDDLVTITGKLVFGNTVYYLSNDWE